ncbi:MAG: metal ABC transporter ATP-binding protein [Patescibacteria group bacterium]
MEPTTILSVYNLSVTLGHKRIIHDVSFSVQPQEVVAIIGPNGAGKSILVKTLIGLTEATSGKIEWQPGTKVGYLPQRFHVDHYLPMTIKEFLDLKPKRAFSIHEVLELTKLDTSWLKRPLAHLSSGQLQHVLLAWAILDKPQLLIFDEPTENVDVVGQESIYTLLHNLQDTLGIAMMIVSHDLHVVYRYANTVICLNGKMVCYGAPETALTTDKLSELYGNHAFFHHHHYKNEE